MGVCEICFSHYIGQKMKVFLPFLFALGMLYYLKVNFQKRSYRTWLMKLSTRK